MQCTNFDNGCFALPRSHNVIKPPLLARLLLLSVVANCKQSAKMVKTIFL